MNTIPSVAIEVHGYALVGQSVGHRRLLDRIRRIAPLDAEVLITGPTGVGKELYSRLVHHWSARNQKGFLPVNCGAVPGELFESEMFGHSIGAFTGANGSQPGLVGAAEQGTLFLDEIDALPLSGQVKLLRLIQQREYRRLGESFVRRADIRIIAATNQDLPGMVEQGRFREDLYYRLNVVSLNIPPLAERMEDLPCLLDHFSCRWAEEYGLERAVWTDHALECASCYRWPGNVREVENVVRQLTCEQLQRPVEPRDLPAALRAGCAGPRVCQDDKLLRLPFQEAKQKLIRNFELEYLKYKLNEANGNITHAAQHCRKNRRAFYELLRKHGLTAGARLERAG